MSKLAIPSFFFPTTVVFIDDNIEFLRSVAIGLDYKQSVFTFYSDPKKALQFINSQGEINALGNGLISLLDEEELEHRTVDINAKDLYRTMYNKERFKNISCVVVDFHMAGMDGIEFCESIKNPNIQKILLTSIVDESKAIDVLNSGTIDTFVRKQSCNMMSLINQSISKAQERYFLCQSQLYQQIANITKDENALLEPAFQEIFNKIINDFKAIEYYLAEWQGSFVFLNSQGENYGLMVKTKEQIASLLECEESESAPKDVLDSIKRGNKLFCHHSAKNQNLPNGAVWEQYLFPAQKLFGSKTYFCAHGPEMFDIDRKKLLTFDRYTDMQ